MKVGFDAVWLERLKQVSQREERLKCHKVYVAAQQFDEIVSGVTDAVSVTYRNYRPGDSVLLIRTYNNQRTAERCVALIKEVTPDEFFMWLKLDVVTVYEEG